MAQETEETTLLAYLETLEKEKNVRFSYVREEVEGINLKLPSKENASIEDILSYLRENTPFHFNQINERYITIASNENSGSLCGRVIDLETQLPLEGATIISENNTFNTITNAEGFFYIPPQKGNTAFTVSFVGYSKITKHTSELSTECTAILLTPSVLELAPVLVQNIFTKGISKNLDGSILLATQHFGLLPGQVENDVLQIVQALPGVESADETISNINIRGGTHDENLLLWDDIKMYQSGHFFGLISAINPDITKQVTLYKNGTNIRYGEGVSGVLNMRSKNTVSSKTEAGIGFNLINGNGFLDVSISENLSIQVAARKSINHLWESPVYENYTKRIFQDSEISNVENAENNIAITTDETFDFYDFSTKLLWDISEKDKLRVNFLTIDNSLDFTETMEANSQSKTSELDQRSLLGGVSWNRLWNDNIETTALAYGTYYLLDAINKDIFTTQEQIQKNEVLETGLKFDANIGLSETLKLQTGYQFSEIGIANTQDVNLPRFRDYEKDVLRTHALFTGLNYVSNNQKTFVFGGVRGNYFSKFEEVSIEPRLSLHQKFGNGFAIEVLGEFKSQSTTQRIDFESDFLGIEKRRWVLADEENTPIIKSRQASAGVVYSKNGLFMNAEGFYKIVEDINSANQGLQNQFQFSKAIGNYTVKGAEFVINKKTKAVSIWASYMYSKNDYEFEALSPSTFPNNLDIQHTATLAGSYAWNALKIALGLNWHSGKPYTIPLKGAETTMEGSATTIQFGVPNGQRLPDYFRTDLSAEYLWKLSPNIDAKINIALLNLLNTENTVNIRYALIRDENNEVSVNKIEEISLGITPNFSFQVLF
ncbi:carboxypeptidase-like regulatory domain-containing protein [Aequorivita todarodis]|uniref:TonB-dependent receptor n=1 Tax=Aequorivita todarodis TaxID=2036821 RepID=UPI0023503F6E|nr:carboxypeptidase-like regulatory domain-containing protein [Aequorivita todarodis]MDC7999544.1 carboxypeptidase-like regulatory domain-containing protein [Aequorivita todarodis]